MTRSDTDIQILLVDDRPENLLALEAILSPLGHTLVRAGSGREALKALLDHDFAVILLDVQLPGMDGYETAALIRSRERSQSTPILFLTAVNTSQHHVFRGYEVGAVDYLLKPIEPAILLSKVSVFVDLYRKALQIRQQAAQLARTIRELEREIEQRQLTEDALQEAQSELERRVRVRTADLSAANEALRREIEVRERAEQELSAALLREQAARERAEKAVRTRDDFLAVASHELKTPLTAIYGNVEILHRRLTADEETSGRNRRSLQVVLHQVLRLSRMVEMLLDSSRIQNGLLTIEIAPFDLAKMTRRVVLEVEPMLERHQINLVIAEEDLITRGDELRMEQVLYNLVNNAIKYSPNGGTVTVRAERRDGAVTVAVADQGIGIPEHDLPHIFERFYRAESAEVSQIAGMGIGLYVVQQVVVLHGGRIEVSSASWEGSTFTITLPAEALAPPALQEEALGQAQPATPVKVDRV
ncbi:MAG: response regulator [Chloroflexales bacterium]|nr:response regulator [Chloroflexales bacterium]